MNATAEGLLWGLLLGLAIGLAAAWLILRARMEAALATQRADQASEQAQVRAELSAVTAQRDAALRRTEQLAADQQTSADRFKVLSQEALQQQTAQADRSAEVRLKATEALLSPVKEGLQKMSERLAEVEKERAALAAELRNQVQTVALTGDNLRRETNALVTALRRPQVRGAWGEMQLKRVAEITGMLPRCDFDLQDSTPTESGAQRPDMTVRLAGGKVIFVDSKTPLSSFLDAADAGGDADLREQHLQHFARTVRTHVEQLSSKSYWKLDSASPEFVVMFLPSEAFLQAALERDPDLQEFATKRHVVLATPSILIPLLQAVQHGWQQEALAESAAEVARLGRELHERLATMGSHFDKLGRSLTGAVKSYNAALSSLESRVLVTARRFEDLEVTRDPLPAPEQVEQATKVMTAPELVDDAAQVSTSIAQLPAPGEATTTDRISG